MSAVSVVNGGAAVMADGTFDRRRRGKDKELEIQGTLFNVHRPCCLLRRGRWETLLNDNLQVSVPYYGTVPSIMCAIW